MTYSVKLQMKLLTQKKLFNEKEKNETEREIIQKMGGKKGATTQFSN